MNLYVHSCVCQQNPYFPTVVIVPKLYTCSTSETLHVLASMHLHTNYNTTDEKGKNGKVIIMGILCVMQLCRKVWRIQRNEETRNGFICRTNLLPHILNFLTKTHSHIMYNGWNGTKLNKYNLCVYIFGIRVSHCLLFCFVYICIILQK